VKAAPILREIPSHPRLAEIAFPILALTLLAGISILCIVDVDLTIRRNVWGFGQVLALLLLVIPLRDAGNAILDIRRGIQGHFEELFKHECKEPPVLDELQRLVDEGADPRQWRMADNCGDSLQIAAHYGKLGLVEWLSQGGFGETRLPFFVLFWWINNVEHFQVPVCSGFTRILTEKSTAL